MTITRSQLKELSNVNNNFQEINNNEFVDICISKDNIGIDELERTVIIESNLGNENEPGVTNSENGNEVLIQEYQYTSEDFCGKCGKNFYQCRSTVKLIGCDQCGAWYHISCVGISKQQYEYYSEPNNTDSWVCKNCKNASSNITNCANLGNEESIIIMCKDIYKEIVGWSKNLFILPRGKAGKEFIMELDRLIGLFVNKTSLQRVSLLLLHIFMPIMLQKPSEKSKAKDHSKYLSKRLEMWENGDLKSLMAEAREIQKRHKKSLEKRTENKTKRFCQLMLLGKVAQANKLINNDDNVVGVHDVTDDIVEILRSKHPKASHSEDEICDKEEGPLVQPVIFESIDSSAIYRAAKSTFGSGGPTLVDADGWKHILCSKSYGNVSDNLCRTIADMAKILCTETVESTILDELLSCRLIPLDKNPGVRPIGVGEVLRRIIGKAVMRVLKEDIIQAGGALQTCTGIESGIEAAVHAMADEFHKEETEAILLVDATNAFNSMNRAMSLKTVKSQCPTFYQYLNKN